MLQFYENGVLQVRHPRMSSDIDGTLPEQFTKAHPEYGAGNIQQMHTHYRMIEFDKGGILS